ncbi:putative aminohydrolase SsnA [Tepidibacter aestuarii]|uniref:putative aminohydrolase SsnA n=1 Tax=Tepidibacter aestuarii TaxID=2925782 RepID=UPI0020BDF62B|nr:putative aminohydrolase SsnA [Tepidibacter aestuarii]
MLLVGNGKVITQDKDMPYIENGCIAVKDNVIIEIGKTEDIKTKYHYREFLDAKGKVIMPGMVNTHHHIYSAFARGMPSKSSVPKNFTQILEGLWWKIDKALNLEDVKYSAYTTYIDCIKNGTTTIFDHHASQGAVRESLFTIGEVSKELGVRSCLCYEVSDRDGKDVMEDAVSENIEFMKKANSLEDDMLRGMFGLHASFTLSDETLYKCVEEKSNINGGFHIHTAEGIDDLYDSLKKYGKRVVKRLMDFNILGEKTIAVHCIHVNDGEIELLKETKTNVVHNPESNMGNAVGCSPVIEMIKRGVLLGLGTDGYTSDMFESLKVGNIIHKHNLCNPSVAWTEMPQMLFENNRKISSEYFNKPVGVLKEGAHGDIIIVDYNPLTIMNENNYDAHILFGMSGRNVETTIINGKVVMKDRKLVDIDEEKIYEKSRELSSKLWDRI